MKCVILCAGYGTRLYPLTKFIPKSLLPINGEPILNKIVRKVEEINEIDEIFVTTSEESYPQFEEWHKAYHSLFKKKIKLFKNTYFFKKKKLGGIDAIDKIMKKYKIKDDFLVIGGDNLFDFKLTQAYNFFKKVKSPTIILHKLKDKKKASSFGVVTLKNNIVVEFEEKPKHPKSDIISTAIYFFPRKHLDLIEHYNKSPHKGDSFGNFLRYLHEIQDVYGFVAKGIFIDIGNLDDYKKASKLEI
ncbi:MAG: nucleotidyltransferase family protein [Nanoarchaeota archaeon]